MSRNRQSQRPRRVLINYPRAFFEVDVVRPDESQELAKANSEAVFVSGGISIPSELNHCILKQLTGKEFLKVAKISKAAERVVRKCKALLFDTIHERINELNEMSSH